MQFAHTEEQQLIRETARGFFDEHATSERVRAALQEPRSYDDALWRRMAAELGWAGIAIPERYGGSGLGWIELCLLQEEQGRRLVPSPFFATVALGAPLIERAGDESQRADLLGRIAAGDARVAVAVTNPAGQPGWEGVPAMLTRRGDGFVLSGVAEFVVHADAADVLLVLAREPGSVGPAGVSVVALPAGTAGVEIAPHIMMDLTRPMSRVALKDVAVSRSQVLGEPGGAAPAIETALDLARIALASEALGGAERMLETTTDYAKSRVQFGRPIGSFQAIKHRLADMMVLVEAAKSAAWYAATIASEGSPELAKAAAIAKSYCCDAAYDCAANGIQIHGGIGFTWEHDAHLYFKRARAASTLLGSPAWQRDRLARVMDLGDAPAPAF